MVQAMAPPAAPPMRLDGKFGTPESVKFAKNHSNTKIYVAKKGASRHHSACMPLKKPRTPCLEWMSLTDCKGLLYTSLCACNLHLTFSATQSGIELNKEQEPHSNPFFAQCTASALGFSCICNLRLAAPNKVKRKACSIKYPESEALAPAYSLLMPPFLTTRNATSIALWSRFVAWRIVFVVSNGWVE